MVDGLTFRKGHRYHYVFTHRATRPRTYFTIEVSYAEDGRKTKLPYYYGDTLGDTVALAAKAEVDFVTFSTDSSWGCEGWWNPPEAPEDYSKIVQALKEGPLEIDFGSRGTVRDALTGAFICNGPKAVLQFRLGETRLFKTGE